MEKLVTLRYAANCKRCSKVIEAGERAYWLGSGSGVRHIACENFKPAISAIKEERMPVDRHTVDYADIVKWYREVVSGGDPYSPKSKGEAERQREMFEDEWTGTNSAEMLDFIARGYHVPGLDGITALIPARPRRRLKLAEEGDELLLDLVWDGSDTPFAEWEKRVAKPGLSVDVYMTFSSYVSSSVLTAYFRWVARALQTLDQAGIDMEVNVVNRAMRIHDGGGLSESIVRVRKPGEAADFSNWSAMFSPGGLRHLGFVSIAQHADSNGYRVRDSYGHPAGHPNGDAWDVLWDDKINRVVFLCDSNARNFPEIEMTEKLQTVMNEFQG